MSKRKRGFTSIRAEEENLHKRSSPESNKLFHIWLAARLFTQKKKLFSTLLFCLLAQRKLCPRSDWQLFSPFLPCHQTGALCCVCTESNQRSLHRILRSVTFRSPAKRKWSFSSESVECRKSKVSIEIPYAVTESIPERSGGLHTVCCCGGDHFTPAGPFSPLLYKQVCLFWPPLFFLR